MSYKLIGILMLGAGQIATAIYMVKSFHEVIRIERLITGLVVQESHRIQEATARS